MSRALMSATIADQAGNAIQGAVVVVYETGGTTPVADMFTASSGGSPVTTLTSDSHGLIKGWFTVGRLVDLKVTDNTHAAYRPASPAVHLTFADYTITVAAVDVTTDMATQAELDAETTARGTAVTAEATARVAGDATSVATAAADATTKANAAQAASQPLDSDLTAIAALSTTTYGRALLALADAAAGRTALGLGTAAVAASTAFDAAGAAAAAQAASQPVDSDLTAIAALSTTAFGRSFLDRADASAARTLLGLGTAATTDSTSYARLAPTATNAVGNSFAVPNYTDDTVAFAQYTDQPSNNAPIFDIFHYGTGSGAVYSAYAMNWRNEPGANTFLGGHQYSSLAPWAVIDNTGHQALLKLQQTENQTVNPNSAGTGAYVDLFGYPMAQVTDGTFTSGANTLSSPTLAPVSGDLGHSIIADQVPSGTYITAIPTTTLDASMNGVVLTGAATINVVSVASFAASGSFIVATSGGSKVVPYTGKSVGSGPGGCDQFTGCSGLSSSTMATGGAATQVQLSNNASSNAGSAVVLIARGARQSNMDITAGLRFVAKNALLPPTFQNLPGILVTPLKVRQYNNFVAFAINNQGSGDIIRATSNSTESTVAFQVLSSGQIKTQSTHESTGAGSAALGANSPAVTNTAPFTWLKFTSSDGSQVYIPAWK